MSKNLFNSVKMFRPKSNFFDLTHTVKFSCNMGSLVPIMCTPAVPGDRFKLSCQSLIRFQPLVAPAMHRFDAYIHYFFVPNRILWPNWEKYITNTLVGGVLPAHPTVSPSEMLYTKLFDYLGIPQPSVGQSATINALPFAAYAKIYNEYYRDQNLITELNAVLIDGANDANDDIMQLRTRAWNHDYFTSCLPFAQKGDSVDIPLGKIQSDSPVKYNLGPQPPSDITLTGAPNNINLPDGFPDPAGLVAANEMYAETKGLEVDPTTINDLRRAFRLQEWLEKAARGGSRYIESILAHFGVKSSDKRLQRPEYITGAKTPIVVSEVLNTTGTVDAPQGAMAGHAFGVAEGNYGGYFCEEHGYIMGIMSVMPKTAYQDGIAKHFLKFNDPFEHFWPSFANIGEQEVLNRELYAYGATPNAVFGYVPRYAEYKFENDRVAGDFRTSLDFWHMGRQFSAQPSLNKQFIDCVPDYRIFAVPEATVDHVLVDMMNIVKAVRPMPKFGTPQF